MSLAPTGNNDFSFSPFLKTGTFPKLASPLKHSRTASTGGAITVDNFWADLGAENEPQRPHTSAADKSVPELFGVELPSDDPSEEGIDIFQDFGKIGGGVAAPDRSLGSPMKKSAAGSMGPPARPSFQRSNTSRW